MKPTWRSATAIALALWTLTACQTPRGAASSDVTQLQAAAAAAAIDEFCRGQEPRALDTIAWCDGARGADGQCLGRIRDGVTLDDYRAAPEWARIYVVGNDEQWARPCGGRR